MESSAQAVSLRTEPAVATYFECLIPGSSLRVRLNLLVVDRLGAEVMEGCKAVPRRGLEVGGLLIGKAEADCVTVDQLLPIVSEHKRGPSWLLSEKDEALLAESIARANENPDGTRMVGLYRSHTRSGAAPAADDMELVKQQHEAGARIFLLLKPEPGQPTAASLYAAGEGLQLQAVDFPLQRAALHTGDHNLVEAPPLVEPLPSATAPPQPELTAHPQTETPIPSGRLSQRRSSKLMEALALQLESQKEQPEVLEPDAPPPTGDVAPAPSRRRRLTLGWAVAILLCAGVSGYAAAHWWNSRTHTPAPPLSSMALSVTWASGSLHLSWDRQAPLIRKASRGVVWIGDGDQQRRLDLDARELTEGSIQYWPSSSEVGFKMEVYSPNDSASESVRAVNVPRVSGSTSAAPKPESRTREDWVPYQARPAPQTEPTKGPVSSSLAPQDHPPFARVEVEVLKQSPLRNPAGTKRYTLTELPKPLHAEIPAGTPALRSRLQNEQVVDVKLDLDVSGKVKRAELVSRRSEGNRELETIALNASRRWTFTPARSGERRILSRVILHYHFGQSTLAAVRPR